MEDLFFSDGKNHYCNRCVVFCHFGRYPDYGEKNIG